MSSVANLCVVPIQDYLGLSKEARINTPSTLGHHWKWRLSDKALTKPLSKESKKVTKVYARL